jgi:hypothetical protein
MICNWKRPLASQPDLERSEALANGIQICAFPNGGDSDQGRGWALELTRMRAMSATAS